MLSAGGTASRRPQTAPARDEARVRRAGRAGLAEFSWRRTSQAVWNRGRRRGGRLVLERR